MADDDLPEVEFRGKKLSGKNAKHPKKPWTKLDIIGFLAVVAFVIVLLLLPSRSSNDSSSNAAEDNVDFYELLGLTKAATDKEIKSSYKSLALKLHPDKNPNCADCASKFSLLAKAYETLSNPHKRRAYDQTQQDVEAISSTTPSLRSHDIEEIQQQKREGLWIAQVYADWDPHSIAFSTSWDLAAEDLKGTINLGRINFSQEKKFGTQHAKKDMRTKSYVLPYLIALHGNFTQPSTSSLLKDCSEHNPFKILGISEFSTPQQIKKAFEKIKYENRDHAPSGCIDCHSKYEQAHDAYQTLTNGHRYHVHQRHAMAACVTSFIFEVFGPEGILETSDSDRVGACGYQPRMSIIDNPKELNTFVSSTSVVGCTRIVFSANLLQTIQAVRFAVATQKIDTRKVVFALTKLPLPIAPSSPPLSPIQGKAFRVGIYSGSSDVPQQIYEKSFVKVEDMEKLFEKYQDAAIVELTKDLWRDYCQKKEECDGCLLYIPNRSNTSPIIRANQIFGNVSAIENVCGAFWVDEKKQRAFIDQFSRDSSGSGGDGIVVFANNIEYFVVPAQQYNPNIVHGKEQEYKKWEAEFDPTQVLVKNSPPFKWPTKPRMILICIAVFLFGYGITSFLKTATKKVKKD